MDRDTRILLSDVLKYMKDLRETKKSLYDSIGHKCDRNIEERFIRRIKIILAGSKGE